MCDEPSGYKEDEINGVCAECGEPTVHGDAFEQCGCSGGVECAVCGYSPCDGSCGCEN